MQHCIGSSHISLDKIADRIYSQTYLNQFYRRFVSQRSNDSMLVLRSLFSCLIMGKSGKLIYLAGGSLRSDWSRSVVNPSVSLLWSISERIRCNFSCGASGHEKLSCTRYEHDYSWSRLSVSDKMKLVGYSFCGNRTFQHEMRELTWKTSNTRYA